MQSMGSELPPSHCGLGAQQAQTWGQRSPHQVVAPNVQGSFPLLHVTGSLVHEAGTGCD